MKFTGSITTSFESLRVWDELYFGKKKKRKNFGNVKRSSSGKTMEKGGSSKVEEKAENEKEQENK